ncbi:MAG TPA: MMPL family transporter [Solirubrobacteraceae bacterium]|nr:MMPL family transporter [Solirubrobacteraceae bacterium]
MAGLGRALAAGFVRIRLLVVVAWIAGAVWMAVALPSITSAGSGSIGQLVPKQAPALKAQELSLKHFSFPLLSQTMIVVRNPHGLSTKRQLQLLSLTRKIDQHRLPAFGQIAGAVPLLDTLGYAPFSREHGTTAVLYLFFAPGLSTAASNQTARDLITLDIGRRPGEFEGVTGVTAGREVQAHVIDQYLKWVLLATILVVALAIGLHFRAPGAAALTLGAVIAAYVVADRLVAQLGKLGGVTVPTQVQPVLVVLVFGVVTDYSVFFMSRFRRLLFQGVHRREAAVLVTRQITPIVVVAGVTVAAGTAGLMVARLGFLRAFGPGLAVAVLVAMVLAATLIPAALGLFGRLLFWPRAELPGAGRVSGATGWWHAARQRLSTVRLAVRHPLVAGALAVAIVAAAASGLFHIALGDELIMDLGPGVQVRHAYQQAKMGFAPGVLAPSVVLLTGQGVGNQQAKLDRLQQELQRQRDVVQVLGPRQRLLARAAATPSAGLGGAATTGGAIPTAGSGAPGQLPTSGIVISPDRNAARYALFLGSDPMGARAISSIRQLNHRLPRLLHEAGFSHGVRGRIAGDTALSADTVSATLRDLTRIVPVVLGAIFLVIALYLRALVAPLYLVLTSTLAALAGLGLTVYVLQIWLGYGQITYYIVFTVAVLLVSLGSDYNVFLIGRVWQEGRRRQLAEAVEVAGVRASRPITTAGAVLALSFALLAIVPLRSFRELAFAMAAGLLIDAFIVRTMLVPALIRLVGPASAWPSHRLRGISAPQAALPPEEPAQDRQAA